MRTRLLIPTVSAAIIVLLAVLISAIQAQVTPTTSQTSDIRATVLSVERLEFPRVRLRLRVTESSRSSVLNVRSRPQEVTAQSYLRTSGGAVDFRDSRNIGAVAAYYLLQGDEIRGKLFSGSSTPGRDRVWYVYDIARIGCAVAADPARSTNVQGNLRLTLETSERTYGVGEPVRMTLKVENIGAQAQTLRFSSGQQYDFIVSRDDREVWRWSEGRFFTQALTQFTLAPGAERTFSQTWPQTDSQGRQVGSGEYNVRAVLTTMTAPRPTVGPVTVTIRSRE